MRLYIEFNRYQANKIAEKLMDVGNYGLGTLVISQILPNSVFSWTRIILGVIGFLSFYFVAFILMKGN